MLDKRKVIKVTNRSNCTVGYVIPELGNLTRSFAKDETKEITMDELRRLSWVAGGKSLIKNYLLLDNPDAINELLNDVEPEYFYTKDEVIKLLTEKSLDEFLDALDFAPAGVVNMIKDCAVEIRLNDIDKREALKEKTGFDVTAALMINDETGKSEVETKTRRVEKETKTYTPVRRVTKKTTE